MDLWEGRREMLVLCLLMVDLTTDLGEVNFMGKPYSGVQPAFNSECEWCIISRYTSSHDNRGRICISRQRWPISLDASDGCIFRLGNNQSRIKLIHKSSGPNLALRDCDRAKGRSNRGRSDLRLWCSVRVCSIYCEEGGDLLEVMHGGLGAVSR